MIDTRHGMAQVIFMAEKDGQVEVALLLEE